MRLDLLLVKQPRCFRRLREKIIVHCLKLYLISNIDILTATTGNRVMI